jgi:hypothetical protein
MVSVYAPFVLYKFLPPVVIGRVLREDLSAKRGNRQHQDANIKYPALTIGTHLCFLRSLHKGVFKTTFYLLLSAVPQFHILPPLQLLDLS